VVPQIFDTLVEEQDFAAARAAGSQVPPETDNLAETQHISYYRVAAGVVAA